MSLTMAGEFHSSPLPNAEAFQAPMAYPWAEFITIQHPMDIKNNTERNKYKIKLLNDNPETLFADCYKEENVSNLMFHTDLAWHSAIRAHYPYVKREGIGPGWKLRIVDIEEIETTFVNV